MNNKVFFGLLVLAAGVLVGWFLLKDDATTTQDVMNKEKTNGTTALTSNTIQGSGDQAVGAGTSGESMEKGGALARMVIAYTDSGFAPEPLSVKKGTTVTFVNESSRGMWVASATHPTHQLLPGFDQLKAAAKGGTYEYVFVKVGTWKYHNHVNPVDTGSVVVSQ